MIERYSFYRRYHGPFISMALAPDPALFWGIVGGVLVAALVITL